MALISRAKKLETLAVLIVEFLYIGLNKWKILKLTPILLEHCIWGSIGSSKANKQENVEKEVSKGKENAKGKRVRCLLNFLIQILE